VQIGWEWEWECFYVRVVEIGWEMNVKCVVEWEIGCE